MITNTRVVDDAAAQGGSPHGPELEGAERREPQSEGRPHPRAGTWSIPHPATATEASNGEGTVEPPTTGLTIDRPILDGASEYYG